METTTTSEFVANATHRVLHNRARMAFVTPDSDARADEVTEDELLQRRRRVVAVVCGLVAAHVEDEHQRTLELFESLEEMPGELLHADVEPAERQPVEYRRARYEDHLDEHGERRTGNAKWFREWKRSVYVQYTTLKDADFYEENLEEDAILRREFELKICMPLRTFQELYREMRDDEDMHELHTAASMQLKLIGALQYLAVGCSWDAIEDAMNVSRPVLSQWFERKFVPWMMHHKVPKHVRYPFRGRVANIDAPLDQSWVPRLHWLLRRHVYAV